MPDSWTIKYKTRSNSKWSTISAIISLIGAYLANRGQIIKHGKTPSKTSIAQLRNIADVRKYLTQNATEKLIHAFITSRLDYCNSLLYGLPSSSLKKLQKVQNMAAKILTLRWKYEHITPILQELHWLPVEHRITYNILLTTHRALNGKAPQYITDLLTPYIPARNLRSEGEGYLVVPKNIWRESLFLRLL